jgi:hypothetical protein
VPTTVKKKKVKEKSLLNYGKLKIAPLESKFKPVTL